MNDKDSDYKWGIARCSCYNCQAKTTAIYDDSIDFVMCPKCKHPTLDIIDVYKYQNTIRIITSGEVGSQNFKI